MFGGSNDSLHKFALAGGDFQIGDISRVLQPSEPPGGKEAWGEGSSELHLNPRRDWSQEDETGRCRGEAVPPAPSSTILPARNEKSPEGRGASRTFEEGCFSLRFPRPEAGEEQGDRHQSTSAGLPSVQIGLLLPLSARRPRIGRILG